MPKPISVEEYLHILKQAADPDNPLIDSIQIFMDSNDDLIAQIHGGKDPGEVQQFQIIDFDGYITIPVGNQAIDLLAGHFFKSTPDQDAEWTTTSERQGWLVWLHVDNTGEHTITFGSGFTDVDDISASGIQNKLLYYDGSTWREIAIGGGGGVPGGSNTQVQFNDSNSFGGDSGLTYNKATDELTVLGDVQLGDSWHRALSSSDGTKTIYVDQATGNDTTGDGSSALPYATIGKAIGRLPRMVTEDTVIAVGKGSYDELMDSAGFQVLATLTIKAMDTSGNNLYDSGTATSGGNNTLTDTGKAWAANIFDDGIIWIWSGTGKGQKRSVASHTATEITVTVNWGTNPDATSKYVVIGDVSLKTVTSRATAINFRNVNNVNIYGFQILDYTSYGLIMYGGNNTKLSYCYIDCTYAAYYDGVYYSFFSYTFVSLMAASGTTAGLITRTSGIDIRGTVFLAESQATNVTAIYATMLSVIKTSSPGGNALIQDCVYGILLYEESQLYSTYVTYVNCTTNIVYPAVSVASLSADRTDAQPIINVINRSATERDPVIKFQVGASPATKVTLGIDDSDLDKFKVALTTLGIDDVLIIDQSKNVEFPGHVKHDLTAYYDAVYDNGNSGANKTIDWNNGNVQMITTTSDCVLTFTAPPGPCHLTIIIIHENSSNAYTYTYPATVKWANGAKLTTSNVANAIDIVSFLYCVIGGNTYYLSLGNILFS